MNRGRLAGLAGIATFALHFIYLSHAHAHPRFHPVRPPEVAETDLGEAHGGYGYVATSEAEALQSLLFSCSPNDRRRYLSAYDPRCLTSNTGNAANDPDRFITETMRALILDRVREHYFEYLTLQAASCTSNRSQAAFPVPSCLQGNTELEELFQSLPPSQPSNQVIDSTPMPIRRTLSKFRAVGGQLTSGNVIRALIFSQHMETLQHTFCNDPDPVYQSECLDLRNQADRIRASFPVLFQGRGAESRRNNILHSVEQLLGSRYPRANTPQARQDQGHRLFVAAMQSNDQMAEANLERELAERAGEARAQSRNTSRSINEALSQSLRTLNDSVRDARNDYLSTLTQQVSGFCGLSLDDFMRMHPNIVRQTLTDLPPSERNLAQAILCSLGVPADSNPRQNCIGVSGARNSREQNARVQRMSFSFPYMSGIDYRISQNPPRPPEIELTINVDTPLEGAQAQSAITNLESQVNTFYNCQTGATRSQHLAPLPEIASCPSDPAMAQNPVHFNIRFHRLSANEPRNEPLVHLYNCYNVELPEDRRTNCNAIRNYHLSQCVADVALRRRVGNANVRARTGLDLDELLENISHAPSQPVADTQAAANSSAEVSITNLRRMNSRQIQSYCNRTIALRTPESLNRQDSSDYTIGQSPEVALHEVGHLLGLDDEYSDPSYPFLPLGEHNSLMGSASLSTARIYPRHLRQMLAPLSCPGVRRTP